MDEVSIRALLQHNPGTCTEAQSGIRSKAVPCLTPCESQTAGPVSALRNQLESRQLRKHHGHSPGIVAGPYGTISNLWGDLAGTTGQLQQRICMH